LRFNNSIAETLSMDERIAVSPKLADWQPTPGTC
jgi:hypothetical protein